MPKGTVALLCLAAATFPDIAWANEVEGVLLDPSQIPGTLLGVAALLGIGAFFASSESALFSLQKVDREALKHDGRVGELVTQLLHRPQRVLAALLIGNELSNIGLSALTASVLLTVAPSAPWLNVVVVAPVLILCGDVLPKTLGFRYNRAFARVVVRPLNFWSEMVSPIRWALSGIVDSILKVLGVPPQPEDKGIQEDQLRTLIDQGLEVGAIQPMEQEIIHRVFEFGEIPVSRLMTPRPDIFGLSITTPWADILAAVNDQRYSRVPFWQGNPDNVVGILLMKDLLRLRASAKDRAHTPNIRQLQKLLHPVIYVPPGKLAQDLLREFRAKKQHMAMVVDEHGSITGLITLDDLLTELVGEVLDENDGEDRDITPLQTDAWSVKAGIDIEDFGKAFGLEFPESGYTTLAGFVLQLLGAAPQKGDEVEWTDDAREHRFGFHVSGLDGRRITEVTVRKLPVVDPAGDDDGMGSGQGGA